LAALLIGCIAPISAYAQEPIQITAQQLYDEYEANEIAADQKYKGKIIEVSGKVNKISKSAFGDEPLITLDAGVLSSIFCYFHESYESQLAKLVKGQSVIVQGVCVGIGFVDPKLEDCVLIQPTSPTPSLTTPARTPAPTPPKPEEGEDEGCFIATATYGTDTAQEIDILREFRDEILLPNGLGAEFVSLYYKNSPPIANFISKHEVLRTIVREGFVDPIVAILNWTRNLWSE